VVFSANGKSKEYTIPIVAGACLNFVLNLVLIPRYGAAGAAFATTVTEGIIVVIQLCFLRGVLQFTNRDFRAMAVHFLAAAVMAGITYFVSLGLHVPLFWALAIKVAVGAVVYAAILLLLRDQRVLDILKKITSLKHRAI